MSIQLNLFISHLSTDRKLAKKIAGELKDFQITPFVAHEDIEPTSLWQNEIEEFLKRCDCMLALLTKGYFDSVWCNQEIGYCLGREIPLISIRAGEDPKGFAGKWQAYSLKEDTNLPTLVNDIVNLLGKKATESEKIRSWLIESLCLSRSFDVSNKLCDLIEPLELKESETQKIRAAYNDNGQVSDSHNIKNILGMEWINEQRFS